MSQSFSPLRSVGFARGFASRVAPEAARRCTTHPGVGAILWSSLSSRRRRRWMRRTLRIHRRLRLEEPLDHGIVAGKTIATVGGIQIAQALKYPGTRALLFGDFRQSLQDFFKAPDPQSAVFVADPVFPQLKAEGIFQILGDIPPQEDQTGDLEGGLKRFVDQCRKDFTKDRTEKCEALEEVLKKQGGLKGLLFECSKEEDKSQGCRTLPGSLEAAYEMGSLFLHFSHDAWAIEKQIKKQNIGFVSAGGASLQIGITSPQKERQDMIETCISGFRNQLQRTYTKGRYFDEEPVNFTYLSDVREVQSGVDLLSPTFQAASLLDFSLS